MWSKEKTNIIADIVSNVLISYNLKSEVSVVYNFRVIQVDNSDINIWLRLIPTNDKYIVEISTVFLSKILQRRGIFTSLYTKLLNCDIIEKVVICSVCTKKMENWCVKNNLVSDGFGNYYRR